MPDPKVNEQNPSERGDLLDRPESCNFEIAQRVSVPMHDKILFVDDDVYLLNSIRRALRNKFDIHVASTSTKGLSLIEKEGFFPVVVADYEMPGMDGISFLASMGKISPDSVRMLMTGYAEFDISIRAINEGSIFRFLSKPCPLEVLEKALLDGLYHYRLIQTERDFYDLRKLSKSLNGLIQSLSFLVESKDPYTAGHQLGVSKFSVAIANKLGFSGDEMEQIRMAAIVHDVGKIYVPVEFLNKPGKLNSVEWELVKMHAKIGHDFLAPLGFPFPIDEIVLQHHERLDGSGYPSGLTDEQIHVQAKVIAVADAAEAIAHHRPYRPAGGLDAAIRELMGNSGTKYDPRIVKTAVSLLSEERFAFE